MPRRPNSLRLLAAIVLLSFAGVVFAASPPKTPGNLVANGDFEEAGAEGMPSAWFRKLTNAPEEMVTVERAPDGYKSRWCLRLRSLASKVLFGAYCQPINIPPDAKELLVSFYYRTRDIPQPDVYVLIFNTDFAEREWETPFIQADDHPIPQSRDWALMGWRFRLVPGAKQALVVFRAAGRGELRIDRVSLRVYGDPVRCDVLDAGLLAGLPAKRLLRMRIDVAEGYRNPLTAAIVVREKDKLRNIWRQTLRPPTASPRVVEATYSLDYKKTVSGRLIVCDAASGDVLDIQPIEVPALLDGRIVRPAFRSTLLRSLPCPRIEAAGTVNAVAELARRARITARLVGASEEAVQAEGVSRPSEVEWRTTFLPKGLLTGTYRMEVTCEIEGKAYSLSLPLTVAPPQENAEVAYDDRGILWVAGRPILPRGIYFATTEREVENIKAAGYNFTILPATLASLRLMDKLASLGIYGLVESRSMEYEKHSSWEHLTAKYAAHPALLAWHTVPKPDAELSPPFELAGLRKAIIEYDPHHPVVTCLSMPSLMHEYSQVCDLALIWTDPIPESGPRTVGVLLDEARKALWPKPIWAVIQTVGHHWSWDRKLDPAEAGRPPTPQEHRCMTYLALVHGATGLVNYTYVFEGRRRGANFRLDRDAPTLWTSTIRTNRQLAWLEPLIVSGSWHPLVLSASEDVHIAYWKSPSRILVIAVNTNPAPAAAAFRIPPVTSAMLTDVFSGEKVIGTVDGDFGIQLDGYGVAALLGRLQAP